ncbi:unnamed protein product, partial [Pylaiella littoralis]
MRVVRRQCSTAYSPRRRRFRRALFPSALIFRIQPADFPFSTGAFRSGKYKLIKNEWCTGWYTFDKRLLARDPLTDPTSICNGHPCSGCGGEACGDHFDYLFDLEIDPREENNLIKVYPEIAESLHNRMVEVAFKEWT